MDTYHIPGLFDNQPGSRISERENLGIKLDLIFLDITLRACLTITFLRALVF